MDNKGRQNKTHNYSSSYSHDKEERRKITAAYALKQTTNWKSIIKFKTHLKRSDKHLNIKGVACEAQREHTSEHSTLTSDFLPGEIVIQQVSTCSEYSAPYHHIIFTRLSELLCGKILELNDQLFYFTPQPADIVKYAKKRLL